MISPHIARILCLIVLGLTLFVLSLWQAAIARAALNDTEFGVPGWPLVIALWVALQSTILTITFMAGAHL